MLWLSEHEHGISWAKYTKKYEFLQDWAFTWTFHNLKVLTTHLRNICQMRWGTNGVYGQTCSKTAIKKQTKKWWCCCMVESPPSKLQAYRGRPFQGVVDESLINAWGQRGRQLWQFRRPNLLRAQSSALLWGGRVGGRNTGLHALKQMLHHWTISTPHPLLAHLYFVPMPAF